MTKIETADRKEIVARIAALGVLAVIRGPEPELTLRMVEALIAGGVLGIEITFTTPDALAVVAELNRRYGDEILLGMGTLTAPEHAGQARDAGARFMVSPHTDENLAAAMGETGLPFMLGAITPSEVFRSYQLGSDVVKVFPGSLGGPGYMKALKGPFPEIPMMPTGGVSRENVADWFAAGAVAVGAGSKLCPKELALTGRFAEITTIAADFVVAIDQARSKGN